MTQKRNIITIIGYLLNDITVALRFMIHFFSDCLGPNPACDKPLMIVMNTHHDLQCADCVWLWQWLSHTMSFVSLNHTNITTVSPLSHYFHHPTPIRCPVILCRYRYVCLLPCLAISTIYVYRAHTHKHITNTRIHTAQRTQGHWRSTESKNRILETRQQIDPTP